MIVFWPNIDPPEVYETKYSYKFCRKTSFKNCCKLNEGCKWISYHLDEQLTKYIDEIKKYSYLLVVTEPEMILNGTALSEMITTINADSFACGPAFNESDYNIQKASIPYLYYNLSTYYEVAKIISENQDKIDESVGKLDPACVMFSAKGLDIVNDEVNIKDLHKVIDEKKIVNRSAFFHKFHNYYNAERSDLVDLAPDEYASVLDIGCAKGGYGKSLKKMNPNISLMGIELNPYLANIAKKSYDIVLENNFEGHQFDTIFDLVNCGDVIEHLYDPWGAIKKIYGLLKLNGCFTASVPNVGHWSILSESLKGNFEYIPVGLLCVSHIRWFTEKTFRDALEEVGFKIDILKKQQEIPTPSGERFIEDICKMGYGDRDSLLTSEFLVRAFKR